MRTASQKYYKVRVREGGREREGQEEGRYENSITELPQSEREGGGGKGGRGKGGREGGRELVFMYPCQI